MRIFILNGSARAHGNTSTLTAAFKRGAEEAGPIYFFSPSAQLEAAIQRMHAKGIPDNIRESAMILTSGSPGVYDAAKAQYKAIFDYLGTRNRGIFTACGSESRSERKQKELEDFGRSLVS